MATTSSTDSSITAVPGSMVIDGRQVDAQSGERFQRHSPAHDVVVSDYPSAAPDDIAAAVAAAREAFDAGRWSALSGAERSRVLRRVSDIIHERAESLARIEALESGKPITQALDEMAVSADLWEYAATLARQPDGDAHNSLGSDVVAMVLREPVGVVGIITPWNFPLLIISQKLPFALAAGCTAVVKPSEFTPGTTARLALTLLEAGLPPGVVNVVTGAGDVGTGLLRTAGVDMWSFTGSTEVGRLVAAAAGEQLARVELELGGKNPQIICADADLEAAADAIVFGAYFNAGQCCNGGSRALVEASIAPDFASAVVERSRAVPVGDPLDPATKVGAIVSQQQLNTIERYVAEGHQSGAKLLLGGERLATPTGRFFQPTVFSGVTTAMSIAQEEIFGPVLSMLTFEAFDNALTMANDTTYGLSAGIWTSDLNRALTASRTLRAGTVWVNRWMDGYPELPFGGYRASGLGRELGHQALDTFSETKTVQLQVGERTDRWLPAESDRAG